MINSPRFENMPPGMRRAQLASFVGRIPNVAAKVISFLAVASMPSNDKTFADEFSPRNHSEFYTHPDQISIFPTSDPEFENHMERDSQQRLYASAFTKSLKDSGRPELVIWYAALINSSAVSGSDQDFARAYPNIQEIGQSVPNDFLQKMTPDQTRVLLLNLSQTPMLFPDFDPSRTIELAQKSNELINKVPGYATPEGIGYGLQFAKLFVDLKEKKTQAEFDDYIKNPFFQESILKYADTVGSALFDLRTSSSNSGVLKPLLDSLDSAIKMPNAVDSKAIFDQAAPGAIAREEADKVWVLKAFVDDLKRQNTYSEEALNKKAKELGLEVDTLKKDFAAFQRKLETLKPQTQTVTTFEEWRARVAQEEFDFKEYKATVDLLTMGVSLFDPKVAHVIAVTGNALVKAEISFVHFQHYLEVSGKLENLGKDSKEYAQWAGELGGGAVLGPVGLGVAVGSCVLDIVGLFNNSPSPEQQRFEAQMEALKTINANIGQLRTEMHQRFDIIDSRLEFISNQLSTLESFIGLNDQEILTRINAISQKMNELDASIQKEFDEVRSGFANASSTDFYNKRQSLIRIIQNGRAQPIKGIVDPTRQAEFFTCFMNYGTGAGALDNRGGAFDRSMSGESIPWTLGTAEIQMHKPVQSIYGLFPKIAGAALDPAYQAATGATVPRQIAQPNPAEWAIAVDSYLQLAAVRPNPMSDTLLESDLQQLKLVGEQINLSFQHFSSAEFLDLLLMQHTRALANIRTTAQKAADDFDVLQTLDPALASRPGFKGLDEQFARLCLRTEMETAQVNSSNLDLRFDPHNQYFDYAQKLGILKIERVPVSASLIRGDTAIELVEDIVATITKGPDKGARLPLSRFRAEITNSMLFMIWPTDKYFGENAVVTGAFRNACAAGTTPEEKLKIACDLKQPWWAMFNDTLDSEKCDLRPPFKSRFGDLRLGLNISQKFSHASNVPEEVNKQMNAANEAIYHAEKMFLREIRPKRMQAVAKSLIQPDGTLSTEMKELNGSWAIIECIASLAHSSDRFENNKLGKFFDDEKGIANARQVFQALTQWTEFVSRDSCVEDANFLVTVPGHTPVAPETITQPLNEKGSTPQLTSQVIDQLNDQSEKLSVYYRAQYAPLNSKQIKRERLHFSDDIYKAVLTVVDAKIKKLSFEGLYKKTNDDLSAIVLPKLESASTQPEGSPLPLDESHIPWGAPPPDKWRAVIEPRFNQTFDVICKIRNLPREKLLNLIDRAVTRTDAAVIGGVPAEIENAPGAPAYYGNDTFSADMAIAFYKRRLMFAMLEPAVLERLSIEVFPDKTDKELSQMDEATLAASEAREKMLSIFGFNDLVDRERGARLKRASTSLTLVDESLAKISTFIDIQKRLR